MRRLRLLIAALGAVLLVAAPAAAAPLPGVPAGASLLFTVDADGGTLRSSVLTLRGIDPSTVWFTDRPDRDAGRVTTAQLVAAWRELGFDEVAPNAALVLETAPRRRDTVALELRSPTYDAKRRALRFAVRRLDGLGSSLSHLDARVDTAVAKRFGAATLFIDNASTAGYRCALGQPQLFASNPQAKRLRAYRPADGATLPWRGNGALGSVYGTVFGGDSVTTFALPALRAPAAGTAWSICAEGRFPTPDDLGRCEVGEVDLWASGNPALRAGDDSWLPADGRTIEPERFSKRFEDLIGEDQARFTLPNVAAPGPGLGWMVCVSSRPDDDPAVGQLDLFAQPPRDVGRTWVPADGRTIAARDAEVLASWLNGGWSDRDTITVPKVDPPAPGLQYYIAIRGEWLGRSV